MTLFMRYNDAQTPFFTRQWFAVASICNKYHAIRKSKVKFRQSEDGFVSVRRFHQQIKL